MSAANLIDTNGRVVETVDLGKQSPECVITASAPVRLRVFLRGDDGQYREGTFLRRMWAWIKF